MIHGILLILKIIGIILVSILLLLLLIVTLLLFVPIRYKVKAQKEEALVADAKATWLLSLLSVQYRYKEEQILFVRLFGIPIYDSRKAEELQKKKQEKQERKNRKKRKKEEKIKNRKANKSQLDRKEDSEETVLEENSQIKEAALKEETSKIETSKLENTNSEDSEEEASKKIDVDKIPENHDSKIVVFFKKIVAFLKKIRKNITNGAYTIQKFYDRIVQMGNTISYYYEVWNREETQKAFRLCKHSLVRILKQIKPRKIRIFLRVGTDDPAATGQILVFYSMCYPYIGKYVSIEPDFEQFILEGNVWMKGKITIFVLLSVAWKLFFDKNIRNVLVLLKKEEL